MYEIAITDDIVAFDVSVYSCINCIYHYEKSMYCQCLTSVLY